MKVAQGDKRWTDEAGRAPAGAGLPWQLSSAWCQQGSTICCAEFTHRATGKMRKVSLCSTQFATPAARRDEVVRQLLRAEG